MLTSEEPVDFVSVITNEETVYRAISFACPGAAAHPNQAGRHDKRVRTIAEQVLAQLPGASALPPLGPDLTWRGLLGGPTSDEEGTRNDGPKRTAPSRLRRTGAPGSGPHWGWATATPPSCSATCRA